MSFCLSGFWEEGEIQELREKAKELGISLQEYLMYEILVKLNEIESNQKVY